MKGKRLVVLLALLACMEARAQDGHYWTEQYGTKSMLLSGSVIGGVEDLGAVYYNPGRLSMIENPAFLLSASVYEYTTLTATDVFGAKQSTSRADIRGVPTMAAGTFKLKFLPNHKFAYAIITRQNADMSFNYLNETHQDVLPTLPGDEWFSGKIGITGRSNEQWVGVTWSHKIHKKVGIGMTMNYVTNQQHKGSQIDLRALSSSDSVAIYHYGRTYNYKETGLLWKIGVSAEAGKWILGLTVKSPMLMFTGEGEYGFEEFFSSIPHLNGGAEIYTTSYQTDLPLTTREPWSIGLGITRPIGKSKLHLSTEWYTGVAKYTMMTAQDHPRQGPTGIVEFDLTDQQKGILNAGIGMELYFSQHISGFASFSTDFSTVADDITRFAQRLPEASNSSWKADFYNWGGGVVLHLTGAHLTLGVTHTGAQLSLPQLINFPDNGGSSSIFDPNNTSALKWERYRLVFSFSFPFLNKLTKKKTESD